ncbi:hypothetical protein ZWY2020_044323 [Hordeum vulgare]|nr:hypothetical protein ZWY2020_044323 [Hordeum vulgare]
MRATLSPPWYKASTSEQQITYDRAGTTLWTCSWRATSTSAVAALRGSPAQPAPPTATLACAHHARLWFACADEPIHPGSSVTYAAVRAKLDRIMASDYYTAAAVGGYGAEDVQAQESMAASPEASAVEENLAPEGHKVKSQTSFLFVHNLIHA